MGVSEKEQRQEGLEDLTGSPRLREGERAARGHPASPWGSGVGWRAGSPLREVRPGKEVGQRLTYGQQGGAVTWPVVRRIKFKKSWKFL